METIYQRIAKVLQDSGKLQPEFADSIGVSGRTLFTYLRAHSKVSVDALAKICMIYNVDANWLLTGEGPIYKSDSTSSQVSDMDSVQPVQQEPEQSKAALLAQIREMQQTITTLTETNRQLVAKVVKE
jgi:transcriptional regulator with XRE-family HTH domain